MHLTYCKGRLPRLLQLTLLFLMAWLGACAGVPVDPTAQAFLNRPLWTATHLHVFQKQYLYWQNYPSGTILPVGTPVRLASVDGEKAVFQKRDGEQFLLYWRAPEPGYGETFAEEIHKYFAQADPWPTIEALPEAEKKEISVGNVSRGMSKRSVLFSWGWPLGLSDPLAVDCWVYQWDRWTRRMVEFADGVVVHVVQP